MKTTLALLLTLLLFSCKKETPEPTPVQPSYLNQINFNGTLIQISNTDTSYYSTLSDVTYMTIDNANVSLAITTPGNDTGTFHIVGNMPNYYNSVWINGVSYSHSDIWIYVSRYDTIGGRVQGTFSGTYRQNSDTTVVIPANGTFDLLRGEDY